MVEAVAHSKTTTNARDMDATRFTELSLALFVTCPLPIGCRPLTAIDPFSIANTILPMFMRFVRSKIIEGMQAREGFFRAAYDLQSQPDIDRHTLARLEDSLAWFRKNLAVPQRFNLSKSKGFYRRKATRGVSWFKPTAAEHLARAFDLAALLEEHGHPIELMKSSRLGYVVYEDEYQIVAEPFSDMATR